MQQDIGGVVTFSIIIMTCVSGALAPLVESEGARCRSSQWEQFEGFGFSPKDTVTSGQKELGIETAKQRTT